MRYRGTVGAACALALLPATLAAPAAGQAPPTNLLQDLKVHCIDTEGTPEAVEALAKSRGYGRRSEHAYGRAGWLWERKDGPARMSVSAGKGTSAIKGVGNIAVDFCKVISTPAQMDAGARVQAWIGAPQAPIPGGYGQFLYRIQDGRPVYVPPNADGSYDKTQVRSYGDAGSLRLVLVYFYAKETQLWHAAIRPGER